MENTLESFQGRTVHTFHTEGSGGGHAPDIMVFAGKENILPSSTNPTNPYTTNAIGELLDMVWFATTWIQKFQKTSLLLNHVYVNKQWLQKTFFTIWVPLVS